MRRRRAVPAAGRHLRLRELHDRTSRATRCRSRRRHPGRVLGPRARSDAGSTASPRIRARQARGRRRLRGARPRRARQDGATRSCVASTRHGSVVRSTFGRARSRASITSHRLRRPVATSIARSCSHRRVAVRQAVEPAVTVSAAAVTVAHRLLKNTIASRMRRPSVPVHDRRRSERPRLRSTSGWRIRTSRRPGRVPGRSSSSVCSLDGEPPGRASG